MEERILKYLPFVGGMLVFLGVLKITVFYQYFGITILPYLSLSDVLLLFLNDLNTVLAVVIISVIHIVASGEALETIGSKLDFVVLRFRKAYIIFFGVTFSLLSVLVGFSILDIAIWNIYLIVFLAIQFLTFIFIKKSINGETGLPEIDIKAKKLLMLLIVLVVTAMIPMLSLKDIKEIKENNEKVVFQMENGEKMTNSKTKYYLGKAGEYHFFYNSKLNKSIVIPNSDVKRIEKLNHTH